MKKGLFQPNISRAGRLVRGLGAVVMFVLSWFAFGVAAWAGILCLAIGIFALFEALRGWCGLRACGIKTKL